VKATSNYHRRPGTAEGGVHDIPCGKKQGRWPWLGQACVMLSIGEWHQWDSSDALLTLCLGVKSHAAGKHKEKVQQGLLYYFEQLP